MQERNASLTLLVSFVLTGVVAGLIAAGFSFFLALSPQWKIAGGAFAKLIGVQQTLGWILLAVFLLLLAVALIVFVSVLLGFIGSGRLRARLSVLANASALFAAGKLGYRIELFGDDDIAVTARQLNVMAQKLQDQVKTLQETARDQLDLRKNAELSATLRERERVRRELHDRVSQDLFGLSMLCSTAVAQSEKHPAEALRLLPDLQELAKRTQSAMRALLLELRPLQLQERSLAAALEKLTTEMAARTSQSIHFRLQDSRRQPEQDVIHQSIEDTLFLIGQEALINALRHAEAGCIEVQLHIESERIVLRVQDDGKGLGEESLTSLGIRSMVERAELIGGSCTLRSTVEGGTEVLTIIPRVRGGEMDE